MNIFFRGQFGLIGGFICHLLPQRWFQYQSIPILHEVTSTKPFMIFSVMCTTCEGLELDA